ncbi:TRAP transporter permease [Dethiobacter alkaliphilus]|uniref:TRAP transporter permease n=1 Tax=Dethiobacter alkaliphilus TaxID=427926 RepID=UPI002227E728|nr:TRAP transporter permease [Dethiobacter alkaliphilus]MCW3489040.1 TRAP transporter permease [Dethiobacter alkaliphilus]
MAENDKKDSKKVLNELEKRRELKGWISKVAGAVAILAALFHLYTAGGGQLFALSQRAIHLAFIGFLAFLYYPSAPKQDDRVPVFDMILSLAVVGLAAYVLLSIDQLGYRAGEPIVTDWVFGIFMTLLVLELTRRVVGNALTLIAAVFLLYAYLGPYMPGVLIHKGYSLERIFSYLYLSLDGIFGIPLGVSADFIFLFILLGTFLDKSGAGQYFIDMAYALTGWSKGGPAKASILASGLLGSITGSSVANAVTTGTFTVPLMKKVKYSSDFAAGVVAAASTGGQLMPPIMGAAAFIMAEFLGVAFIEIARAALVPAVMYFLSLILMTHFRAGRLGLKPIPKDEVPDFWPTFKSGVHLLLPLVALVVLLVQGASPQRSVFTAIVLMVPVILLERLYISFIKEEKRSANDVKETLQGVGGKVIDSFKEGTVKAIQVAVACACAGIIVGTVTMTGLGLKLAGYIELYAAGVLLYGLLLTMIASLVLGIGLPTTAKYIVLATLVAPALERMDVGSIIGAHLFILYFATDADITPPVSLTAYATAGLAGAEPLKASIEAFKLGLSAYLIPFMFIYDPALILEGDPLFITVALVTAVVGIIAFSASIQGFFLDNLNILERLLFAAGALSLIYPGLLTDGVGVAILGVIFGFHWIKFNKSGEKEQSAEASA